MFLRHFEDSPNPDPAGLDTIRRARDNPAMSQIRARVSELGYELPPPPPAASHYRPVIRHHRSLIVSGQLPRTADGTLLATGKVGDRVDLDTAVACARQCALNILALLDQQFGGTLGGNFERLLRVGVFVAGLPSFTDHHLVADGASDLLEAVLGARGQHARAAVGCAALPLDAPVEVEAWVGLADDERASD